MGSLVHLESGKFAAKAFPPFFVFLFFSVSSSKFIAAIREIQKEESSEEGLYAYSKFVAKKSVYVPYIRGLGEFLPLFEGSGQLRFSLSLFSSSPSLGGTTKEKRKLPFREGGEEKGKKGLLLSRFLPPSPLHTHTQKRERMVGDSCITSSIFSPSILRGGTEYLGVHFQVLVYTKCVIVVHT